MSLYGALTIGVAGLSANSVALSATSSNIANVNTVGYKNQTVNFETFVNIPGLAGNSSAGVSASIGQDVTTQGLPTSTTSPTDMSISGNGFLVPLNCMMDIREITRRELICARSAIRTSVIPSAKYS